MQILALAAINIIALLGGSVAAPATLSTPPSITAQAEASASALPATGTPTYTVKRGDSLWAIGKRYNVTVKQLQQCNSIKGSLIYPKRVLKLSCSKTTVNKTPVKNPTAPPVKKPAVTSVKTTSKPAVKTAPKTPVKTPLKAKMTLTVNLAGGQKTIDSCRGIVHYANSGILAEHNYCGGRRFHQLSVGSIVYLKGAYVTDGYYKVSAIRDARAGNSNYVSPNPYFLQTSLTGGAVRCWYLVPVK